MLTPLLSVRRLLIGLRQCRKLPAPLVPTYLPRFSASDNTLYRIDCDSGQVLFTRSDRGNLFRPYGVSTVAPRSLRLDLVR